MDKCIFCKGEIKTGELAIPTNKCYNLPFGFSIYYSVNFTHLDCLRPLPRPIKKVDL
jgi:hypothetical protein